MMYTISGGNADGYESALQSGMSMGCIAIGSGLAARGARAAATRSKFGLAQTGFAVLLSALVFGNLFVPSHAFAQDSSGRNPSDSYFAADSLTLGGALEFAAKSDPTLQWYDATAQTIAGKRMQQSPFSPPEVSYAREGIDGGVFDEQRFVIGEEIRSPLTSIYARRRLSAERRSVVLEKSDRGRAVAANIRTAFVDLMYATDLVELRAAAVDVSKSLLDAAQRREQAGEAAQIEVLRAQLELLDARVQQRDAESRVSIAEAMVYWAAGVTNAIATPPIALPGRLKNYAVQVDSVALFALLSEVPRTLAAREMVESARLGVRESRSSLFPDLIGSVFTQDFGGGYTAYGYQVGLRLRIPFSSPSRGRMAEANGLLQQQIAHERSVQLQMAASADSIWANFRAAESSVRLMDERTLTDANELLRLTSRAYEIGEVSLVEVLDTRQRVLSIRHRYLLALHNFYRRAIELEQLTGVELTRQIGL